MKNKSISVIGSGIIGICCGLKLQSEGFKVTLIDKEDPISGCSRGNAGHFATEQIFPMARLSILKSLPTILLNPRGPLSIKPRYLPQALPWMIRFMIAARKKQFERGTQALRSLNQASMPSYLPLIKLAKAEHLICNNGYLLTFEGKNHQFLAQQEFSHLIEFNIPQQVLTEGQIKELEPELNHCKSAIYYPDIYHTINPLKFAQVLFDCFLTQGGKFLKNEVLKINPIKLHAIELMLKESTLTTQKVIVAAGAYSKNLVKQLGHRIPLDTERGYHLMLRNKALLNRPVAFAQRKFIITPMQQGTRLAGTVEFAGIKSKPNWNRAYMLLKHAQHFLKPLQHNDAYESEKWMGLRPSFPDSLPVIDQDENHPNIYYAFGHQHLGLTQAAITADLMSHLILGIKPNIDLCPFSINRF